MQENKTNADQHYLTTKRAESQILPALAKSLTGTLTAILNPNEAEAGKAMLTLAKQQAEITLHQSISEGTQLSKLKRLNEEKLLNAVMGAIVFVCHSLNVGKNMTKLQIYATANVLIAKHPTLKIEEMLLAFREGTSGAYGSTFDRVDVETLATWIDKFLSSPERADYFEKAESKRRAESAANAQAIHDVKPELVRQVVDSFKPERKLAKPDPGKNLESYLQKLEQDLKVMTEKEIFVLQEQAQKANFKPVLKVIENFLNENDI